MNVNQTNDWSQIDTEAMARINPDAATMARAAIVAPALAWSAEPQEEFPAPQYSAARPRRLPRAMALAGIGAGAAAAIATGLFVAFGTHAASATVSAPNAAPQAVSSAPMTSAAAPTTPAAAPTSVAPVAPSRHSDSSNTPNHNCPPHQSNPTSSTDSFTSSNSTYSSSDDSSDRQQHGNRWPRDFRLFLPHFDNSDNSNSTSYDHDSSRGNDHSEHHRSDSSSDDNR